MTLPGFGVERSNRGRRRSASQTQAAPTLDSARETHPKCTRFHFRHRLCKAYLKAGLVVLGLCHFLACRSATVSQPAEFFPTSKEVAGWSKTADTRTFNADRLWEYIDGDAEKYIQAGVQRTLTSDYRFNEKIDAVADIHVMSASQGAGKLFDSEPATGSQAVQIGDAGRLYKSSLTFHKGPYFVRLVAYEESPDIAGALQALALAIAHKLP